MTIKIIKYIVLVIVLLGFTLNATSQVNISAQLINRELRVFFLSDFNLTGRGTSSGEIFRLVITNGPSPTTFQLRLEITLDNTELLATGITQPVTMDANSFVTINNHNLFAQAQKFSLQDYNIENAGKHLRDQVLTTGKLPSGLYRFTFQLINPATVPPYYDEAYLEIDVTNPTHLDLIGPGAPADRSAPEAVMSTLPVFRWTSNITKFRLQLAEKLADVHDAASPSEIIQDRIRFERTFTIDVTRVGGFAPDGSEYLPTPSFQYPVSGAWPLERGKVYYWQIIGMVPSSGAVLELPSEIWAFQVGDLDDRAAALAGTLLMERLHALFGDQFDALFAAGGELAGFSPTGKNYLNGRWLTAEEVQALLAKITGGEYLLVDMRVE